MARDSNVYPEIDSQKETRLYSICVETKSDLGAPHLHPITLLPKRLAGGEKGLTSPTDHSQNVASYLYKKRREEMTSLIQYSTMTSKK